MRNWRGIHNEAVEVGDGLTMLRNVSLIVNGQLSRRPQLGSKLTLAATLLTDLHPRSGGDYLVSADGSGKLVSVNMDDGSSTDVATGLSYDIRGCFASVGQMVYYTNDFDRMKRVTNGTATAVDAGIAASTSAPVLFSSVTSGGSTDAGVHLIRYRYKDSKTGFVSNPSPEYELTAVANAQYSFTKTASSDAKVDTVLWEATAAGGTTFYQLTTQLNSSTAAGGSYTVSDTTLTSGLSTSSYYGDYGHEQPPITELVCEHRGRLFGFKASTRTNTAVSVALSAKSVSGSGFSTNWAGRLVSFAGSSSVSYVINTVSSGGTSLSLLTNFAGSTNTAASMTIYSGTPDMLYWSRAGFPESWKPSTWARRVLNNGDKPTAIFSAYNTLWLCGTKTIKTFDYTADPAAARISTVPTQLGVYNQRCVVNAEGRIFCFGSSGIFELRGRVPTMISSPVDQDIAAIIDITQSEDFHGEYDYYEDAVTFRFVRTGDTACRDAVTYHLQSGEWTMRSWRQGIQCSTVAGTSSLAPRPYLGCDNGYVWRLTDDRVADGLPASLSSNGVLTVASAASTTSIPVDEALPTGSDDLTGLMLYNPETGEAKAITSNTATTITCAAFSTAPADGDKLYLGSIDVFLKSEWWAGPSPHALKRVPYCMFEHVSDTTAPEALFKVYTDLSSTAKTFTKGVGDSQLAGITYSNNGNEATLDFSQNTGLVYMNLPDTWAKYWRYELTQEKPYGTLKLMDAKFILQNRTQVDAKVKPT